MLLIVLGTVFLMAIGCDSTERISRLEKQNEELQAEIKKSQATTDYDLQAKCSRDAKGWFTENWSTQDKTTILLNFTNHYNKGLNKCFILVEYHFSLGTGDSWIRDITLWDIYENSKYGNFAESHTVPNSNKVDEITRVNTCELLG